MPLKRAWVKFVEDRYGITLTPHACELDLENLIATQSEIELIKYEMVRYEGYRITEPILVFKGRYGGYFIVDGHTRARVEWDAGDRTMAAILLTSPDADVCADLLRSAQEAGGGKPRHIEEVPVVDRVGKGTDAWRKRRHELLEDWRKEQADRHPPEEASP